MDNKNDSKTIEEQQADSLLKETCQVETKDLKQISPALNSLENSNERAADAVSITVDQANKSDNCELFSTE